MVTCHLVARLVRAEVDVRPLVWVFWPTAICFALHLETKQWHVRHVGLVSGRPRLFDELPTDLSKISAEEVVEAGRTFRKNRATGLDNKRTLQTVACAF